MSEQSNNQTLRRTTIGGQALIEGLMMIGPEKRAMAVRNPEGEIELEFLETGVVSKAETIPFLRGPVRVFKQLVLGTKALMRSADIAEPEDDEQETAKTETSAKEMNKKTSEFGLYLSAIVSILFSVLIFMLLPGLMVDGLKLLLRIDLSANRWISLGLTLLEGLIRFGIFIL